MEKMRTSRRNMERKIRMNWQTSLRRQHESAEDDGDFAEQVDDEDLE